MENLGENVKQLREEVKGWEELEGQEELERAEQELRDQIKEVPIIPSAPEQFQSLDQSLAVTTQIPSVTTPILSPPSSGPVFAFNDTELQEMRTRFDALKFGQKESGVAHTSSAEDLNF